MKIDIRSLLLIVAISIAISFTLYGNTIPGKFVYDDSLFINRGDLQQISALTSVWNEPYLPNHPQAGAWRPFSLFLTAAQLLIIGKSPIYFHIRNIVLYGTLITAIYFLIYELFRNKRLSLLTTLLFTFLPIHTEAVASIKSGEDLLGALLFMSAWLAFLVATRNNHFNYRHLILSAILLLFSVLSKETFIFGPYLIIGAYIIHKKTSWKHILIASTPFIATTTIYLVWRFFVLSPYAFGVGDESFVINPIRYVPLLTRIWTGFSIAFHYVFTIIIPLNLTASYHYNHIPLVRNPLQSWPSLAGIAILCIFVFLVIQKKTEVKTFAMGSFIFLASYFVVSKFILTGGEIMAERWMLIPSLGIALIGGQVLDTFALRYKILSAAILFIILIWYTSIIIPRNTVWLSNRSLIYSMVTNSPDSVQTHYLLADRYFAEGNYSGAETQANIANKIYSNYAPLLTLRASLLGIKGNYGEAKSLYIQSAKLDPAYFPTFRNLAIAYYATGEYEKARSLYIEMIPNSFGQLTTKDYIFYAATLAKLKLFNESIQTINQYVGNQKVPEAEFILAVDYYKIGNIEKARQYFSWDTNLSETQKIQAINDF